MPELPEIYLMAQQMQAALPGKTFTGFEIIQPKCLNVEPEVFSTALNGATIQSVKYRGKWIIIETSQGWLLLCLGMGGEILLVTHDTLPEKYRLIFDLNNNSTANNNCLAINFWWFGYAHHSKQLSDHKMTAKLGPNAIDISSSDLQIMLSGRRGKIKTWLLDQSKIAGIGNFYIHDILFKARLHPLQTIDTLNKAKIEALYTAIQDRLGTSIAKGGAAYEQNLYGEKGNFDMDDLIVGYREGQSCPSCGTTIEKIKTGSTSSFICPTCQSI